MSNTLSPNGKKIGRPRKVDVESKLPTKRGKGGRPKGDAGIINEYKARMLASPKSQKVLDTILNAALNDDHKNQGAAWELLMDRMLPISYFEKDSGNYMYVDSYLFPERYFEIYSDLLGTTEKQLRAVGELCTPPDLNKETLIKLN